MIRITDQYFWNFVFLMFFLVMIVFGAIILDTEAYMTPDKLTVFDVVLMSLATWRFIRFFVYDEITKFFREQFWDAKKVGKSIILEKPPSGPRRTLADLLSCPWCIGAWAGASVTFFYLLTPYAFFPVLLLSVSAIGTLLQVLSNMVGWNAEKCKRIVEEEKY